jgi:hypothetical protein
MNVSHRAGESKEFFTKYCGMRYLWPQLMVWHAAWKIWASVVKSANLTPDEPQTRKGD